MIGKLVDKDNVNIAFNIAQRHLCENAVPRVFSADSIGEAYVVRGMPRTAEALHAESLGGAR